MWLTLIQNASHGAEMKCQNQRIQITATATIPQNAASLRRNADASAGSTDNHVQSVNKDDSEPSVHQS